MVSLMHETEGQWCTIGGPAAPGGCAVTQRSGSERGGAQGGCVTLVGEPLEKGRGEGQRSGAGGQSSAGTTRAAVGAAEGALVGAAIAGAASPWPCQPALDAGPGGAGDRGKLRHKLSPGPRLEDLAGLRLERPEAGTASARAGRRADPTVAAEALAPYKKRRATKVIAS